MIAPKSPVPPTLFDKILFTLSLLIIVGTTSFALYKFNSLPNEIPTHFGLNGKPDFYNEKGFIWFLVGINVILYVLMLISLKYPTFINYPFNLENHKNAELHYKNAFRMIRVTTLVCVIIFSYLIYATIETALGKMNGVGISFLFILLGGFFPVIIYFLYKGSQIPDK